MMQKILDVTNVSGKNLSEKCVQTGKNCGLHWLPQVETQRL